MKASLVFIKHVFNVLRCSLYHTFALEATRTCNISCTCKWANHYGVPKRTKLFFARADLIFLNFARADLIHFISRARMPVHHGRIVSTSFYNTTIPMTICYVATFISKSQSKSELQVSEDGGKKYTTMTQSCERF